MDWRNANKWMNEWMKGSPGSSFYTTYCAWSLTCLCTNLGWVYMFLNAEFNFTASFFVCIDTLMHVTDTSNSWQVGKLHSVLKCTVCCHVIFPLLTLLGWHLWLGSCLSRLSKEVKLQRHQPWLVGLKLRTIQQECLYQAYQHSSWKEGS